MAYVSYLFIPPSLHPDQVVVAVDVPLEQAIRIDSFCHANGIAFIRVRQHERGEEMADPGDALRQCPEWDALHLPCQLEPLVSPVWCQLRRPTSAACSHPFSATLDRSSLSTMWMVSGLWKWLVVRDARTPGHGQPRSLHSFSKCLSSQHYKSRMQSRVFVCPWTHLATLGTAHSPRDHPPPLLSAPVHRGGSTHWNCGGHHPGAHHPGHLRGG